MTVLVAGGGIAGLAVALSLHQIGVKVGVFESVSELKPLGVGINVLPHACRELIELGLFDKLDETGVRTIWRWKPTTTDTNPNGAQA